MKVRNKKLAIHMIFIIISSLSRLNAQSNPSNIARIFASSDTSFSNQDVHLILYKDNTFLNYGLYLNKAEDESYVWYAFGIYTNIGHKLILDAGTVKRDKEQVIKEIKYAYKRRKDHLLIDDFYEFSNEKYKSEELSFDQGKLTDSKKKIVYYEKN